MNSPIPRFVTALLTILTLCVIAGCKSSPAGPSHAPSGIDALVGEWTVSDIDGQPVSTARPPSLLFSSDGKVAGFTGVNRLASTIDTAALGAGEFKLSPTAVTRMAGPPESMATEKSFLSALHRVTRCSIDGDVLLLNAESLPVLTLVRTR